MDRNTRTSREKNRRSFLKRLVPGLIGGSVIARSSNAFASSARNSAKVPASAGLTSTLLDATQMYVGEICIFPYNFAPLGWALCNGQLIPISQNTALFSLLGTMYGGDGRTTFALPNLQGMVPINDGQGPGLTARVVGESGGSGSVTLNQSTIPLHSHLLAASSADGSSNNPNGKVFAANAEGIGQYNSSPSVEAYMNSGSLSATGGNLSHNNRPPYLPLNFCIATQGIYPARPPNPATGSNQFIGDIILFAGNFVPSGYADCDGALVPIAQNDTLFSLIGTTYGGDGITTFGLPDLRGRAPVHVGPSHVLGQNGGTETETLTVNQMPVHSHYLQANSGVGISTSPSVNFHAANLEGIPQFADNGTLQMNASAVGYAGGSQPHENMPPFLTIKYCIAIYGIFPPY